MKKKPPAKARRAPRNPHARALKSRLFRGKVVPRADRYRRSPKHKKPPEPEGEG